MRVTTVRAKIEAEASFFLRGVYVTGGVEVRFVDGNRVARRGGLERGGARLEVRGATSPRVVEVRDRMGVGSALILSLPVPEVDMSGFGLKGEEGFVRKVDPREVVFDTVGESHAK